MKIEKLKMADTDFKFWNTAFNKYEQYKYT